ncbi:MAG: TatD family hydrolase, partial [bacterium]|nr:TatD family hydrolase [bacterium]
DTHCHLNFKAFENDLDKVIKEAIEQGVTKIINVGSKIDSSQKAVTLTNQYENLFASVGIHPHHADKLAENWLVELENLVENPKVVAIGECGMDFYPYESNGATNPKLQEDIFIKQIKLSNKLKLPLIVHNRQADEKIIEILAAHKNYLLNSPGVFHCFSGSIDLLKKVVDLGFYVGFDGNITYKGIAKGETTKLKDLVKFCPIDRILTETDAPYLTPIPHRGERNEPKYVIIVANAIAQIKGVSFEKIREESTKNALNLFKLK